MVVGLSMSRYDKLATQRLGCDPAFTWRDRLQQRLLPWVQERRGKKLLNKWMNKVIIWDYLDLKFSHYTDKKYQTKHLEADKTSFNRSYPPEYFPSMIFFVITFNNNSNFFSLLNILSAKKKSQAYIYFQKSQGKPVSGLQWPRNPSPTYFIPHNDHGQIKASLVCCHSS